MTERKNAFKELIESHPLYSLSRAIAAELDATRDRIEAFVTRDTNEEEFQVFLQDARSKVDLTITIDIGMHPGNVNSLQTMIKNKAERDGYEQGWQEFLTQIREGKVGVEKYLERLDNLFSTWVNAKKFDTPIIRIV